jgi:nucleoid-associated protein YgaU
MAQTKAQLRKEIATKIKEFEEKGGKITKGPSKQGTTGVSRGQKVHLKGVGQTSFRGPRHHAINSPKLPAGSAAIANVEEAKKKADAEKKAEAAKKKAEDAKKKADAAKKTGSKLPVPIKVIQKAIETGTLDKLLAAAGRKAGEIRKWLRTSTGQNVSKIDKVPKKDMKPPSQSGKLPPAIRSKPQPGTSKIPRSGIKPPSQSSKPKPLPSGVKPKAAIPPITSGDDKGKGRGTHTPYTVRKDDTLSDIAHSKGTTLKALLAANNIAAKDANKLRVGQKLTIPGKVKDRKSVYQGMTKSQMAAMHMPKKKKSVSKMTDPTWGKAKPKVDDFTKISKPKKKSQAPSQEATERKNIKPIQKKRYLDEWVTNDQGQRIKNPNPVIELDAKGHKVNPLGRSIDSFLGQLVGRDPIPSKAKGGKITAYKKGGKVKKVRKASRPRGVGIALRGWGKAMR